VGIVSAHDKQDTRGEQVEEERADPGFLEQACYQPVTWAVPAAAAAARISQLSD